MKNWKSRYSVSRYFTPPKVDPINLDVASLYGGGYAPAQFEGETHDGREIYCRYRDGQLTVQVAENPGEELPVPLPKDWPCLLKVIIGPPLHGGMTLAQLCHYAGITINGERPPPPTLREMEDGNSDDLSGARTFYNVWLDSTLATQKRFLNSAFEKFPEMTVVQSERREGVWRRPSKFEYWLDNATQRYLGLGLLSPVRKHGPWRRPGKLKQRIDRALRTSIGIRLLPNNYDRGPGKPMYEYNAWSICERTRDLVSDSPCMLMGKPVDEKSLAGFLDDAPFRGNYADGVIVNVRLKGFQRQLHKIDNSRADHIGSKIGKKISIAAGSEQCLRGTFSLRTDFGVDDDPSREFVERLDELVDQHFPMHQLLYFDLISGEKLVEEKQVCPLDPEVVSWCDSGSDRWLYAFVEGGPKDPKYIGVRAVPYV